MFFRKYKRLIAEMRAELENVKNARKALEKLELTKREEAQIAKKFQLAFANDKHFLNIKADKKLLQQFVEEVGKGQVEVVLTTIDGESIVLRPRNVYTKPKKVFSISGDEI